MAVSWLLLLHTSKPLHFPLWASRRCAPLPRKVHASLDLRCEAARDDSQRRHPRIGRTGCLVFLGVHHIPNLSNHSSLMAREDLSRSPFSTCDGSWRDLLPCLTQWTTRPLRLWSGLLNLLRLLSTVRSTFDSAYGPVSAKNPGALKIWGNWG